MSLPDQTSVETELARFEAELAEARTARDAQSVRDRFLGRKNSVVASWMQLIAGAPPAEKPALGRYANELKRGIEERWQAFVGQSRAAARPADAVDVTLPGRLPGLGRRHPLTIVRERMEAIFTRMGFALVEGPEIDSTCRPSTLRGTCRTRCTSQRRSAVNQDATTTSGRCSARTPRRCRSGTCRRTRRPSGLPCPDASTGATTST
jgi:hypothetical protein